VKIRLYECELTSAIFLIEKRSQKKFHHISKIHLFPLSAIATLTALAVKFFNYKEALQAINIEEYLKNPLTCDCSQEYC
jgi:hypothetical protein